MQKGKKSREAGKGRNKVKRVGGKMGKETTKDKACVGTTVQEELEQPQKGHGDAWEGAAVQEPASVPRGDYRGKQKSTRGTPGETPACVRPQTTVGLKSPGPETQFTKNQMPKKINREASRTHALSIVDRSRICFASYEQINSIDECT